MVIYDLAIKAGVKFDAHYSITTVDPPELVKFIRQQYPDVERHRPEMNMFQLIVKKGMPPTRMIRYCCEVLKEGGGEGRICVTGVRWAESPNRKKNRDFAEVLGSSKKKKMLFNDNEEDRRMFENCQMKGKRIVNPIIDWLDDDIWKYIRNNHIPYCHLYDEGFKRLGCIMCPMQGTKGMAKDAERWPRYYALYMKAFEKMIEARKATGDWNSKRYYTAEDVMHWWIYNPPKGDPDQGVIFE